MSCREPACAVKFPVVTETTEHAQSGRPVALVTGVGRTVGIGAGVASQLAASGWDIAFTYWHAYEDRMDWGPEAGATAAITQSLERDGATAVAIEADLAVVAEPARVFDAAEQALGDVTALVMCHCEAVDSGLLDTTVESFDRHFAVNARATWLLIREFGLRFRGVYGSGRIISLTSDHTAHNLPYGRARARWTGSRWRLRRSSRTWVSARTRSTQVRSIPAGCQPRSGRRASPRPRSAGSGRRRTPRTWWTSSARRRAAGSTASSSTATAVSADAARKKPARTGACGSTHEGRQQVHALVRDRIGDQCQQPDRPDRGPSDPPIRPPCRRTPPSANSRL